MCMLCNTLKDNTRVCFKKKKYCISQICIPKENDPNGPSELQQQEHQRQHQNRQHQNIAQGRARRKVAKMVLSFVVLFAICFFPMHVFFFWFYFTPSSSEDYNIYWHSFRILGQLANFNSNQSNYRVNY